MTYQQHLEPSTLISLSLNKVVNKVDRGHLESLSDICRQCYTREVFEEEIHPYINHLSQHNDKVQRLGQSLIRNLKIENQKLRHDSVMGCLEGIFIQFGT
jgi:hypothetical protein